MASALWGRAGLVFRTLEECGGHWYPLGVDYINKFLLQWQAAPVPAAGAINMLHADIMLGLVPI